MIGLLTRATLFALGVAIACLALVWLQRAVGDITVVIGGESYAAPAWLAVVLSVLTCLLTYITIRLARLAIYSRTLLRARRRAERARQGRAALARAIIALEAEDGARAALEAKKAEDRLEDRRLTGLIHWRALLLDGQDIAAAQQLQTLLDVPEAADVARAALLSSSADRVLLRRLAAEARDTAGPLSLPAAFIAEARIGAWDNAARTLDCLEAQKRLSPEAMIRRRAVLDTARARAAHAAGQTYQALDLALEATAQAPGLTPAATLAAMLLIEKGRREEAEACLRDAWDTAPHPDLAVAGAAMAPDEPVHLRRQRFAALFRLQPQNAESRILAAELALADDDPDGAGAALEPLRPGQDDVRILMLRAAVAMAQGEPEADVRRWLAGAVMAPAAPGWVCSACAGATTVWSALCTHCHGFDTIAWTTGAARPATWRAPATLLTPPDRPSSSNINNRDNFQRIG